MAAPKESSSNNKWLVKGYSEQKWYKKCSRFALEKYWDTFQLMKGVLLFFSKYILFQEPNHTNTQMNRILNMFKDSKLNIYILQLDKIYDYLVLKMIHHQYHLSTPIIFSHLSATKFRAFGFSTRYS